jgi:hypothetical protein
VRDKRSPENRRKRGGIDPKIGRATQFKPGQSGNPGGRPKTLPITEHLREVLSRLDKKTGKEIALLMAEKAVDLAKNGSIHHLREIADRVEGKPVQRTKNDVSLHFHQAELQRAREIVEELRTVEEAEEAEEQP